MSETRTVRAGAAGWTLHIWNAVESTNDLARDLPAWSAVMAGEQTRGRGRFGRRFHSARGGLWISAVLPAGPPAKSWAGFSMAAGLHLVRWLETLGVPEARLRWPNDLMCANRKLGGLLIEQARPTTLCVGLGVNVLNTPWTDDPSLANSTTRLADCFRGDCPDPGDLAAGVLDALAEAHSDFPARSLAEIAGDLASVWKQCPVVLELHGGGEAGGLFTGIDGRGDVLLANADGSRQTISHQLIRHLRETP